MDSLSSAPTSLSILLVEDETKSLDLLVGILRLKFPDVVVHTATNGRNGLESFKKYLPGIVITDINMPDMNGVQMAREICAVKPDTKLIVLTGDSGKIVLERAIGGGVEINDYIEKPIHFGTLFAAVERSLADIVRQAGSPRVTPGAAPGSGQRSERGRSL